MLISFITQDRPLRISYFFHLYIYPLDSQENVGGFLLRKTFKPLPKPASGDTNSRCIAV